MRNATLPVMWSAMCTTRRKVVDNSSNEVVGLWTGLACRGQMSSSSLWITARWLWTNGGHESTQPVVRVSWRLAACAGAGLVASSLAGPVLALVRLVAPFTSTTARRGTPSAFDRARNAAAVA